MQVWAALRSDWDIHIYNKQREVRVQRKTRVSVLTDPYYWVN